jgi:lipoprotein-anchoring transpeptidase ErfK/SrfK
MYRPGGILYPSIRALPPSLSGSNAVYGARVSLKKHRSAWVIAAVVLLVVAALGGYLVVHARQGSSNSPPPAGSAAQTSPAPGARKTAAPSPHWLVAKVLTTTVVYRRPSAAAPVATTLSRLNPHRCASVMLVRQTRQVGGAYWYQVWLALRPNFRSGWVRADSVATYTTPAKIVVNVAARRLTVYRAGRRMRSFPVAVGSSQYPTPTGLFFVNEKTIPAPGGPYGVLALGLSGFQPRLPTRGALAIHGTNDVTIVGQAVSDGCLRMRNADVLQVSRWVPTGSPVVIDR